MPDTNPLPEADGTCPECGGSVLFFEGETDTRCFNYECGAIVRRMPGTHEIWVRATQFGSPYEVEVEARSGRMRWRLFADPGQWTEGEPPR